MYEVSAGSMYKCIYLVIQLEHSVNIAFIYACSLLKYQYNILVN